MPLEFIDLCTPPVVKVISNNRKVMGKKIVHNEALKTKKLMIENLGSTL